MICANFGYNWPSGSGEEDEKVNKNLTDRRQTDNGRSEKLTFTSCELIKKKHIQSLVKGNT
jgi:hypothetical protein